MSKRGGGFGYFDRPTRILNGSMKFHMFLFAAMCVCVHYGFFFLVVILLKAETWQLCCFNVLIS